MFKSGTILVYQQQQTFSLLSKYCGVENSENFEKNKPKVNFTKQGLNFEYYFLTSADNFIVSDSTPVTTGLPEQLLATPRRRTPLFLSSGGLALPKCCDWLMWLALQQISY